MTFVVSWKITDEPFSLKDREICSTVIRMRSPLANSGLKLVPKTSTSGDSNSRPSDCAPLLLPEECPYRVSLNSWFRIWGCICWRHIPQNGLRCSHFTGQVEDKDFPNEELVHAQFRALVVLKCLPSCYSMLREYSRCRYLLSWTDWQKILGDSNAYGKSCVWDSLPQTNGVMIPVPSTRPTALLC